MRKLCSDFRGDPIPDALIKRVDEYLPDDLTKFLSLSEVFPITLSLPLLNVIVLLKSSLIEKAEVLPTL